MGLSAHDFQQPQGCCSLRFGNFEAPPAVERSGQTLRLPYARRRVTALLPLLENDRPCACGSNKEFPLSRFWIGALPKSRDGESY